MVSAANVPRLFPTFAGTVRSEYYRSNRNDAASTYVPVGKSECVTFRILTPYILRHPREQSFVSLVGFDYLRVNRFGRAAGTVVLDPHPALHCHSSQDGFGIDVTRLWGQG